MSADARQGGNPMVSADTLSNFNIIYNEKYTSSIQVYIKKVYENDFFYFSLSLFAILSYFDKNIHLDMYLIGMIIIMLCCKY